MKAWRAHGPFGDHKDIIAKMTLETVPVPTPEEGEVLIKVDLAAVNPVDWKVFGSGMGGMIPATVFPYTPCCDVAGTVAKVGAGVSDFAEGDKVVSNIGVDALMKAKTNGALAEYAIALANRVSKRGDLTSSQVVGLPLAGVTAYQALFTGNGVSMSGGELGETKEGDKVLILGGSSVAGSLGIQMVKSVGAYVATTASDNKMPNGMSKIDFMKELGADEVIDYKKADWSDVLAGQGFDLIFDCAGDPKDFGKASKVLKKKASYVSIASRGETSTPDVTFKGCMLNDNAADLDKLLAMVKAGKLNVPYDSIYSFDRARDMFMGNVSGGAGKQCLRVGNGVKTGVKVLVTGGSGFLGSWCIKTCLDRGYTVHTTVRSAEKAAFLNKLDGAEERLKIFGGVDLLAPGAFDEAIQGCELVLQTASPFFWGDAESEDKLVKPALEGVQNVLTACTKFGVKKVVVTSSMVSIFIQFGAKPPDHVYSPEDWTPADKAREYKAWYILSKTVQEQKAWEMSKAEGCPWKMATINPCYIFGPMLPSQPALNTSSNVALGFIDGTMPKIPDEMMEIVDVRDVAEAHVAALENDEAFGKRFLMVGEVTHQKDVAAAAKHAVPDEFKSKVPTELAPAKKPPSAKLIDCSLVKDILGVNMRRTNEMVSDTVVQLINNGYTSTTSYVEGK